MKLIDQDYTEQLETEKMMLHQSLLLMVSVVETMALNGGLPTLYHPMVARALDTSWTALDWVKAWDMEQAA